MKTKIKKMALTALLATIISTQSTQCTQQEEKINNDKKINISKEDGDWIASLLEEYGKFEPNNNLDEKYGIADEKIAKILKNSKYTQKCTFKFDDDIEHLVEKIKENSEKYQKTHSEFSSAFQTEDSDELVIVKRNFERIFYKALETIIEKNTNNLNEDFCRMQTLKVLFSETETLNEAEEYKIVKDKNHLLTLGYYKPSENIMVINFENIKNLVEKNEDITWEGRFYKKYDKIAETMYYTISHELNHVRQNSCDCRKAESLMNTFDEAVPKIFIEAAAESEIYNLNKDLPETHNIEEYSYKKERNYELLLLLIAMTKNEASIEEYYNAIDDTNLENLFEFYGIKTEEDARSLIKVMYDIKYSHNYEEDNNCAYRNKIFAMCLYNLVEYTQSHENFSLLDNLMLFNIVKNNVAENTYNYKWENMERRTEVKDLTFAEEFIYLEEKYINFLANYYKESESEIRWLENNLCEYGHSLITLAQNKIYFDWGYTKNEEYLLQEFPLLKPVLYTKESYNESAKELMNYKKKLVLIKEGDKIISIKEEEE